MNTVVFYKGANGRWFWREVASNGRIVSDSGQGYSTRWGVKRAIRKFRPGLPVQKV